MASKISSALPTHLKPSGASNGEANGGAARKHHGKSQSHMHANALHYTFLVHLRYYKLREDYSVLLHTHSLRLEGIMQVIYYNTAAFLGLHKPTQRGQVLSNGDQAPLLSENLESENPVKSGLNSASQAGSDYTSESPLNLPLPQNTPSYRNSFLGLSEIDAVRAGIGHIGALLTSSGLKFKAFENTSTSVAASQMRNALNNLADTVKDPEEKKRFETEMDNFFALFRRYLNDKAKGNVLSWDRIAPPQPNQVIEYKELANSESIGFLNKLAVIKLNGGLGTSMGCVGPKSVIEVRDGMSFLDLSVRQIEYLNRTYDVNVPFVLMNSFNTDEDTQSIIKKYEGHNIDIMTFNQSKYPRILKDSLLPAAKTYDAPIHDWYPPGHGDVFESLYNSGILDQLTERGVEIVFLSNADNLGAVVDLNILQHMVESEAEYIMELTDKTKADVKGGTIIDYEGSVRLLEIAQVPKEHTNEFKSIKKFKYFNTNNIWLNLQAIKRVVENNELEMEIIPNNKSIPADKKGESDVSIVQLETAVGAAIRHFKNAHGVNVPRKRFLPVKTCSDLMLVKSDLYSLKHGQLMMDTNRFGPAPLIKLGNDFKKVSDFQKRIPSIPRILELDHLTITGAVNVGRGVTLKGTVIIVATEGSTIDIPPGSILENVVVQGSLRLLEH